MRVTIKGRYPGLVLYLVLLLLSLLFLIFILINFVCSCVECDGCVLMEWCDLNAIILVID